MVRLASRRGQGRAGGAPRREERRESESLELSDVAPPWSWSRLFFLLAFLGAPSLRGPAANLWRQRRRGDPQSKQQQQQQQQGQQQQQRSLLHKHHAAARPGPRCPPAARRRAVPARALAGGLGLLPRVRRGRLVRPGVAARGPVPRREGRPEQEAAGRRGSGDGVGSAHARAPALRSLDPYFLRISLGESAGGLFRVLPGRGRGRGLLVRRPGSDESARHPRRGAAAGRARARRRRSVFAGRRRLARRGPGSVRVCWSSGCCYRGGVERADKRAEKGAEAEESRGGDDGGSCCCDGDNDGNTFSSEKTASFPAPPAAAALPGGGSAPAPTQRQRLHGGVRVPGALDLPGVVAAED